MTTVQRGRPGKLESTKSFSRYEPSSAASTPRRSRASTISNDLLNPVKGADPLQDAGHSSEEERPDVFERTDEDVATDDQDDSAVNSPAYLGQALGIVDELPIELASLTDRFVTSLTTAKVYPTPLSIDQLASVFQDFYLQADTHISNHIQALALKQSRDDASARRLPSQGSGTSLSASLLRSKPSRERLEKQARPAPGQQMLTPSEISARRRSRRMLDRKKAALEEAVERKVCEALYQKLWRHKSAMDEIRDEKLRSKTAALALVGIGLKDLGVDAASNESGSAQDKESEAERMTATEEGIALARQGILQMNDSHCPLGKLQSLAFAHQAIVDLLSTIHQSNSSADEILPAIIYTLITCPSEGANVVSNMNFIQRFRAARKINGEAAYCLTNLEAAVVFLETVDLATLKGDGADETLSKGSSRATTPSSDAALGSDRKESAPPDTSTPVTAIPPQLSAAKASGLTNMPSGLGLSSAFGPSQPPTPSQQRRLSALFHPPTNPFRDASDAVRNTADQGLRSFSNALDNSFNVLFGRLKEQNGTGVSHSIPHAIVLPKTLDEARRLVSPKHLLDDDGNASETSSTAELDEVISTPRDERFLEMIAGSGRQHDRGNEAGSSTTPLASALKRVSFSSGEPILGSASAGSPSLPGPALSAVDSMRSLGSTLNPLNRLSSISVMRPFGGKSGNASPSAPSSAIAQAAPLDEAGRALATGGVSRERSPAGGVLPSAGHAISGAVKAASPMPRFLELQDASELKLGEVQALLQDYQRLARLLQEVGTTQ